MSADGDDSEPGVPGEETDKDGRQYFFPSNRRRPADSREQQDGFTSRWQYRGHTDVVNSVCITGEDPLGRIRVASTDGRDIHSWSELGDNDCCVKTASGEFDWYITAMTFVASLDVLIAASADTLIVFDVRTLRRLATLSTSKKVLLHLEYNQTRDEIISGGSDGCYVWRLSPVPRELYEPEIPFELALLRGLKRCSHWTGSLVWDEATQVVLVIDSMRVKTYEVTTGTNRHCINRAHEAPVTVGLWFGESESIVTGCMGGILKIWACHHTDRTEANRRRRPKKKTTRGHAFRRRGRAHSPALIQSFKGHAGAVTGLVKHCMVNFLMISSSSDGTLRIWDVDRLAPVTNVRVSVAVVSLFALSTRGGRSRLVCTGKDGRVVTMSAHKVCESLGVDTKSARRICYYPPLVRSWNEARTDSAIITCGGRFVKGKWIHSPAQLGSLLVQMKQGLWGIMSESVLVDARKQTDANVKEQPPTTTPYVTQPGRRPPAAERQEPSVGDEMKKSDRGGEGEVREEGDATSRLFDAWPPLSSVTERYAHHALSPTRREVVCLTDSGILHTYRIGPATGEGEARKVGSWKVDLQVNGATATCMCLLPISSAFIAPTLDRVVTTSAPGTSAFRAAHRDTGTDGGEESAPQGFSDGGGGKTNDLFGCGGDDGVGTDAKARRGGVNGDQVVSIGTSHGGVIFAETVVSGTMLGQVEGLFASRILQINFCHGSAADASSGATLPEGEPPVAHSERLLCVGYNANGTLTIKGLALPSLGEAFSVHLIEAPTCVRVASGRPLLAIGYGDGTVQTVDFRGDRVRELESSALTGAHTAEIHTIAFSERYRCMATGSADRCIMIWDMEGRLLHTIRLQDPALAVEFAEVTGQLVVSQSLGICRIPPCRWCPLRLLVAIERAERREASICLRGSSKRSTGVEYKPPADPQCNYGRIDSAGTCHTEHALAPGNDALVLGDTANERRLEGKVACASGGLAGNDRTNRDVEKGLVSVPSTGVDGVPCGRGFRKDTRVKGPQPERVVRREQTPPVVASATRVPDIRSTDALVWRSIRKDGRGDGEGASGPPEIPGANKLSILDRMTAKVASMSASPSQPEALATEVVLRRKGNHRPGDMNLLPNGLPASSSASRGAAEELGRDKQCGRGTSRGGDRSNEGERSSTSATTPPPMEAGANRCGGLTSAGLEGHPAEGKEITVPFKDAGTSVAGNDLGIPTVAAAARTVEGTSYLLSARGVGTTLVPQARLHECVAPSSPVRWLPPSRRQHHGLLGKSRQAATDSTAAAASPSMAMGADNDLWVGGRRSSIGANNRNDCLTCKVLKPRSNFAERPAAGSFGIAAPWTGGELTGPSTNLLNVTGKTERRPKGVRQEGREVAACGESHPLDASPAERLGSREEIHVQEVPVPSPPSPPRSPRHSCDARVIRMLLTPADADISRRGVFLPSDPRSLQNSTGTPMTISSFSAKRAAAAAAAAAGERREVSTGPLPVADDGEKAAATSASTTATDTVVCLAPKPTVAPYAGCVQDPASLLSVPPVSPCRPRVVTSPYERNEGYGSWASSRPCLHPDEGLIVGRGRGSGNENGRIRGGTKAARNSFFPVRPSCHRGAARGIGSKRFFRTAVMKTTTRVVSGTGTAACDRRGESAAARGRKAAETATIVQS